MKQLNCYKSFVAVITFLWIMPIVAYAGGVQAKVVGVDQLTGKVTLQKVNAEGQMTNDQFHLQKEQFFQATHYKNLEKVVVGEDVSLNLDIENNQVYAKNSAQIKIEKTDKNMMKAEEKASKKLKEVEAKSEKKLEKLINTPANAAAVPRTNVAVSENTAIVPSAVVNVKAKTTMQDTKMKKTTPQGDEFIEKMIDTQANAAVVARSTNPVAVATTNLKGTVSTKSVEQDGKLTTHAKTNVSEVREKAVSSNIAVSAHHDVDVAKQADVKAKNKVLVTL